MAGALYSVINGAHPLDGALSNNTALRNGPCVRCCCSPCLGAMSPLLHLIVSPAGSYITYGGWSHLTPSCPVSQRPGWSTSCVCPMTKRLIRLMVDKPIRFKSYEGRSMLVQHADKLSNETLLPLDMAGTGISRSRVSWGCVIPAFVLLVKPTCDYFYACLFSAVYAVPSHVFIVLHRS